MGAGDGEKKGKGGEGGPQKSVGGKRLRSLSCSWNKLENGKLMSGKRPVGGDPRVNRPDPSCPDPSCPVPSLVAGSGGVFWELVHDTGLGSAFGFVFPRDHMDSGTVGGVLNSKFSCDPLQPREEKAKGLDIAAAAAGVLHCGAVPTGPSPTATRRIL